MRNYQRAANPSVANQSLPNEKTATPDLADRSNSNDDQIARETKMVEELELQRDQMVIMRKLGPSHSETLAIDHAINERKAKIDELRAQPASDAPSKLELANGDVEKSKPTAANKDLGLQDSIVVVDGGSVGSSLIGSPAMNKPKIPSPVVRCQPSWVR